MNKENKNNELESISIVASNKTNVQHSIGGFEAIQRQKQYSLGFHTKLETDKLPPGLNENIIRLIHKKRDEPDYMLKFRLDSFKKWKTMQEPKWGNLQYPPIDFQKISYYAAPKNKPKLKSLDDLDPEIKKTFDRLKIPIFEQKRLANVNVAVDAVFDSVSIATTFQKKLAKVGITFCSITEATHKHPQLIQKYLGSIVPTTDNFYAALNGAVFTDGSFVHIPPNTRCPMELSTYFRINTQESGQFERTLIICEDNSFVSYLEGCSAPAFETKQLHSAVVELVALDNSEIKYSTLQNWYAGDPETGAGGVYNFVTKRGLCSGFRSKISWVQIETGAGITWKYPGCVLLGDESHGEFYSVALTSGFQQADTGSKMIHIGKNTTSSIISKGISADHSSNSYRGLVKVTQSAFGAKNYTQCDSMLIQNKCSAGTFPVMESKNMSCQLEHEASTSRINEEQLLYFQQRGISREHAIASIVNGFCKDVFEKLPVEFSVEASRLLSLKLEDSIG